MMGNRINGDEGVMNQTRTLVSQVLNGNCGVREDEGTGLIHHTEIVTIAAVGEHMTRR